MYKIFGNSHLILFARKSEQEFLRKNGTVIYATIPELIRKIKAKRQVTNDRIFAVLSDNPHNLFKTFSARFTRVNAAGGLVYNKQNKLLLIYRKGYWDLPKGKQDPGETIAQCAKREVMEECGIEKLTMGPKITHTYHYYFMHGQWQLKKTSWYEMKFSSTSKLTPQREEGIEKVIWAGKKELEQSLKKTYPLIRDVLMNYGRI